MKRLLFLHQRPGYPQKLSRQFYPHLDLDPRLSFSTPELIRVINDKMRIPDRGNQSRLVQRIPKIRFPFPGNHRNHALGTLPAAFRTEVETGQLQYLSPILKAKRIASRPQNLGSDIPTKSRN